ncbi:MAG: hypothetical protein ACRD1R_03645 [Acidobacteriota bacterium]
MRPLLTTLIVITTIIFLRSAAMAETKIEKLDYRGWPNSYRISNGTIELVATSDVGPRIIHLGFSGGGKNLFAVFDDSAGKTGGEEWRIYGGHRLWHSPEDRNRTYEPDNVTVKVEEIPNGIRLKPAVEAGTGIQKVMEIQMNPSEPRVQVTHRLQNTGVWPIELAAWALSVMDQGGFAIVPFRSEFHPDGLLPNRVVVLWPYADMADDRFLWGKDHVLLRQVPGRNKTKIGINNSKGWAAYYLEPYLFVKRFDYAQDKPYPDFGASVEVYTGSNMLELETVGPLENLDPGQSLVHEERWELHQDIELDFSEDEVRSKVVPLVE